MRKSSRHPLACFSVVFAFAAVACGNDSLNDDLFADANGTEIAAGATAAERGNASVDPAGPQASGEPSAATTASGSSEVAVAGEAAPSNEAPGSENAPTG